MPGGLDGAIDLRQSIFKVTHDPTVALNTDPSSMVGKPVGQLRDVLLQLPKVAINAIVTLLTDPSMLGELLDIFPDVGLDMLNDWAQGIPVVEQIVEAFTGVAGNFLDLSNYMANWESLLGGLDFTDPGFDPQQAVRTFVQTMLLPTGLFAQALQAFLPDLIPIGALGDFLQNLLPNPTYEDSSSMDGLDVWEWDGSVRHSATGGSAHTYGDGDLKELRSDPPTRVTAGQEVALAHWVRWRGIPWGVGTAFSLSIEGYDNEEGNGTPVVVDQLDAIANPAAGSNNPGHNDFVKLAGEWLVPSGVRATRMLLTQHETVTGGESWWDDGNLAKTQRIEQQWVRGLPAAVQDVVSLIQALSGGLGTIPSIINRFLNLGADGRFNAAALGNIDLIPTIPNTNVGGIHGIGSLGASLQAALDNAAKGAGNILDGSGFGFNDLFNIFSAQQQQITDINSGLAALQADQGGQQNSGKSVSVMVGQYDNGTTPTDMGFTKVVDTGSQNSVVAGGALDMGNAAASREGFVYTDDLLMTDYFETSFIMPRQAGTDFFWGPGTSGGLLYGRSNGTGTRRCYADVLYDTIRIGCVVDGTTTQFGATADFKTPAGAYVTFRGGTAGGIRVFQVLVNNQVRVTRTDTAEVSYYGADYRYCGFEQRTDGTHRPNTISVWTMNDNVPSTTRGVGCRVYRSLTGGVTKASGEGVLPANCLNIIDRITPDMAWNYETQTLTIGTEGWYAFFMRIYTGTAQGESVEWWQSLYHAPAGSGAFALVARGEGSTAPSVSGTNPADMNPNNNILGGGGMPYYCHAGDQVRPGVKLNAANVSIIGDGAGVQTWFAAILVNRSLA